jgi:RNA polymerase sporulation-specific sigma factor
MDGDGNNLSLMDIISQEDDLLEKVSLQETIKNLRQFLDSVLTPREAEIVKMRYGLDGPPKTQREVAEICGISRSYVSRIEKKALEKLKAAFEQG